MALPGEDQIAVLNANTSNYKLGDVRGAVFPPFTTTEKVAISTPKDGAGIYESTKDVMEFRFRSRWNPYLTSVIKTITATTFTITDEDIILADPGVPGADIDITLPPSANRHDATNDTCQVITFRNIHNLNNFRLNIFPDGSETINSVATIQLKRGESITLAPDGSDWWSIST